jgi:hypothetical protein
MLTAERTLNEEVMWRLRSYPVIAVPIPNGLFIPAHTEGERKIVARIINMMKSTGQLIPGAPDLVVLGAKAAALVELKRPAELSLARRARQGQLSFNQRLFRDECERVGVAYVVAHDWEEVKSALSLHGVIAA